MKTTIVGIDPGIIHTGCVALTFDAATCCVDVTYSLVKGVNTQEVADWLPPLDHLFIEDYNPGNYVREDKKMSEALGRLKVAFPAGEGVTYVDNAGINTMIPLPVQRVFKVDKFPVSQHHSDLTSAGKIALFGMLKSTEYRSLVSSVIRDELCYKSWQVQRHD